MLPHHSYFISRDSRFWKFFRVFIPCLPFQPDLQTWIMHPRGVRDPECVSSGLFQRHRPLTTVPVICHNSPSKSIITPCYRFLPSLNTKEITLGRKKGTRGWMHLGSKNYWGLFKWNLPGTVSIICSTPLLPPAPLVTCLFLLSVFTISSFRISLLSTSTEHQTHCTWTEQCRDYENEK